MQSRDESAERIPHWTERVKWGLIVGAGFGPLGPAVTIPFALLRPKEFFERVEQ